MGDKFKPSSLVKEKRVKLGKNTKLVVPIFSGQNFANSVSTELNQWLEVSYSSSYFFHVWFIYAQIFVLQCIIRSYLVLSFACHHIENIFVSETIERLV